MSAVRLVAVVVLIAVTLAAMVPATMEIVSTGIGGPDDDPDAEPPDISESLRETAAGFLSWLWDLPIAIPVLVGGVAAIAFLLRVENSRRGQPGGEQR